jgi:spore coat protein SA
MVYHVLPEVEPFSERSGGALSRWAANMLRDDDAQLICPSADRTWGFPVDRIQTHHGMMLYGKVLKRREFRVRTSLRVPLVEWLLRGVAGRLKDDDILYIHNRPEYVLALRGRTSSKAGYKIVLHMHNDHLCNLSTSEAARLRPDLTIFNSRFLENQGRAAAPALKRTAILFNGADDRCFYPAAKSLDGRANGSECPTVLFVGRLIAEKGVHVLIDAMRQLDAQRVRIRAKIIGSVSFNDKRGSDYLDQLRRNCPANVDFLPYMAGRELAEEFRRASIFCCPSIWEEPFGMVNVEAMASGLPVVASAVGGIPEIFSHGGGVLVPPDRATDLACALKALAEDEPERQRIATQALRVFKQRFRWSVIYDDYRSLIQTLQDGVLFPATRAS